MFIIVFIFGTFDTETYSGYTYQHQGETFACFDSKSPKRYKSKKAAERAAKRLVIKCANVSKNYKIVESNC